MGLYDTIVLEPPVRCPRCGADIRDVQTKAFDCALGTYRVGDCIAHAEESHLIREELFCEQCRAFTGACSYIAVYRGILVGCTPDHETAEALLRGLDLEQLILLYHDLYRRYAQTDSENLRAKCFMRDVCEWFEEGYDKMPTGGKGTLRFLLNSRLLEASASPLEALRRFLAPDSDQEA